MTSPIQSSTVSPHQETESDLADRLFWLAKADASQPRAQIIPDYVRSSSGPRRYRSIEFAFLPNVIRVLKSLDTTRGVSDLVLCASLLAVVLSKYHRDDALVVGLQLSKRDADAAMVPLRLACGRDLTIREVMQSVAGELSALLTYRTCGAQQMAQVLGVELSEARCPFFDVGLAVGGNAIATLALDTYPLDIAFAFDVSAGNISARVVYAEALFEADRIDQLVQHFQTAAQQVTQQPTRMLAEVDVLSEPERHKLLHDFSGRRVRFPLDATLHGLFEQRAREAPNAVAAVYRDRRLTYAELNRRANALAHQLLSLGLNKGAFVGILLDRSCDFVVAMLAVFKAGGAYVPLDPTYPRERIGYMLEDSEAAFVVSTAATLGTYQDVVYRSRSIKCVLSLEGDIDGMSLEAALPIVVRNPSDIAAVTSSDPALPLSGKDRAYMIYTSGSTGRPKGAICRHDGALNHLFGELEGLRIEGAFSFLQTAASSSDISVWQFMAPLMFGGSTVIVDYEVVVDPAQLFAALQSHDIVLAEFVPVVLRSLIDHIGSLPAAARRLPSLRYMMSTGEALATELVGRWLSHYPRIPIANTYGPTETSDDVTLLVQHEPPAATRASVPLGRPLPNIYLFVLDRALEIVPLGVPGEICVAGVGVGEGYWQKPDKTAAAFVGCPFPDVCAGSMYRTGDLGRWLSDGSIEFLGRIDQQVKVRGFRVEPGEIEAAMTRNPAVRDAAVVLVEDSAGYNRLVGYFVARKEDSVTADQLRLYLKERLAEHMVPSALVPLSALPLTPLGKVDRKALASTDASERIDTASYVAPTTEIEQAVAAAWCHVLKQKRVGVNDNFFEIGGDSILTIHVIAELKKVGFTLSPKQLFLHPTVAELAAQLAAGVTAGATLAPRSVDEAPSQEKLRQVREQLQRTVPDLQEVYPLAATQSGIYYQAILAPASSGAYLEQIEFDLTGDLEPDVFRAAWQHVVDTTPVLRTAVVRRSVPQPVQVVLRRATLMVDVQDWRLSLAEHQHGAALASLALEERKRGFDLASPPLTRVSLIRLSERRWHVLWTYHHVILDGWSEPLVLRAVFSAYDAIARGGQPPSEAAGRFGDFVAWSETLDLSRAQHFWRELLRGFVTPVAIKDSSPAIDPPSKMEITHGWREITLSENETSRLEEAARRARITLSTVVHGSWGLLLHRRTGSEDILFGSVASGRQCDVANSESIRGVLVVTQPLRSRLVTDVTASAWLRLLQLQMAEMREFEHTPLALIQQWCEVPPAKRPLFDTLVVMANYTGSDLAHCRPGDMQLEDLSYTTQPLFALTLFVVPGKRLSLRLVYDKRKYAPQTVDSLIEEYRQLLIGLAESPDQWLRHIVAC
jgi:amino acid adenylation domain-containing protein